MATTDKQLTNETVLATVRDHGIAAYIAVDGLVWAYEVATITDRETGVTRDASEWIAVPNGKRALAAWLGY